MNYGYEPTKKDVALKQALERYIAVNLPPDKYGQTPYIELNGMYPGVRIRRITHYSEEIIRQIVKDCDAIYDEIINDKEPSL